MDSKPSNPKDAIGTTKLPLHLIPDTALAYESLAFLEGALKYGKYNWRVAGVRMSIYLDALERHRMKFMNGEWADPVTGVPHLASMRACLAIIIDAHECGKLTDDRPPVAPVSELVDRLGSNVTRLKTVFKDHHPHQHTIEDEVNVETFIVRDTLDSRLPSDFEGHREPITGDGPRPYGVPQWLADEVARGNAKAG